MQPMTRAHKISNLFGAVVPFLAFIAPVVLLCTTTTMPSRARPCTG